MQSGKVTKVRKQNQTKIRLIEIEIEIQVNLFPTLECFRRGRRVRGDGMNTVDISLHLLLFRVESQRPT